MRRINSCNCLAGAHRRLTSTVDAETSGSTTDQQEMVILRITRVRCWKPQMKIDPYKKLMSGHVVRQKSYRSIIGMICFTVCED